MFFIPFDCFPRKGALFLNILKLFFKFQNNRYTVVDIPFRSLPRNMYVPGHRLLILINKNLTFSIDIDFARFY